MRPDVEARMAAAEAALEAGDWERARDEFEGAVEAGGPPAALLGLGETLWWLGDSHGAVRASERAYAAARHEGDPAAAAEAALSLCISYESSFGNQAAARGWLARLARVVGDHELAPLEGWVELCRALVANAGGAPGDAERAARAALDAARAGGDPDLELCALSELGAALVELGRFDEGTELLDEAMAGSLAGEGEHRSTVVYTCCRTIICCSRLAELKRAAQWIRAADGFRRQYGNPHLHTVCRTHYGAVLFATGRWEEAEAELSAALDTARDAEPALWAEALARLAELRLAQGRVDEAERLLDGVEPQRATAVARVGIELARGHAERAAALAHRRLRDPSGARVEAAALLELVVEAEVERGAHEAALATGRRLAELGDELPIAARAERALGRALAAAGDGAAAVHLERAVAAFAALEMPLECARARLLLAGALAASDLDAAIAEARAAYDASRALGAARDADRAAATLRSLGVRVGGGPRALDELTAREREVLALLGEGLSNPQIAERLFLSRKTVEHHVRSVLAKLGLSGRAQAAAYAVRHLERDSASR